MKPRIYDCFCYFNEDMLLELRLETLWDQVDFFVISEATYTQVGNPKPLNFDIERFDKYRSKIRYLVVDHFPPGAQGPWANENYQRNYLINGLTDARPDDWILVSDLDEIPRPETIAQFDPGRYRRADFQQLACNYFLNNLLVDGPDQGIWPGSKLTTYRQLKEFFGTVTAVRSYKSAGIFRSIKRSFFRRFQVQTISDGGWHFSWVTSPELILLKMENVADQQFIRPEHKNLAEITRRIRSGEDVLGRPFRYEAKPLTQGLFPAVVEADPARYAEWLLPAVEERRG